MSTVQSELESARGAPAMTLDPRQSSPRLGARDLARHRHHAARSRRHPRLREHSSQRRRTGSLCVNAGRVSDPIEAEVGAYMEAIEFALALPETSRRSPPSTRPPRDVLDGRTRPEAILDLCPPRRSARQARRAARLASRRRRSPTGERISSPPSSCSSRIRPSTGASAGLFGTELERPVVGQYALQKPRCTGSPRSSSATWKSFEGGARHERAGRSRTRSKGQRAGWSIARSGGPPRDLELHVRTAAKNVFGAAVLLRDHQRSRRLRAAPAERRLRVPPAPERGLRQSRGGGRAEPARVHPRGSRRPGRHAGCATGAGAPPARKQAHSSGTCGRARASRGEARYRNAVPRRSRRGR